MHINAWWYPPVAVIFPITAGHLFLPNSDIIFGSTLFGVFPAFSYFICFYLNNEHKVGVIFFLWSYFVAPKS